MTRFWHTLVITVASVAVAGGEPKAIGTATLSDAPVVQVGSEQDVIGVGQLRQISTDLVESVRQIESDGVKVLIVRISMTPANAARVYLHNVALGSTAKLYIYGVDNGVVTNISGPFEGTGPLHTGEFWTDAIAGSELILELQVTGEPPPVLPFEVIGLASADVSEVSKTSSPAAAASSEQRTSLFRGYALTHSVEGEWAVFESDIVLGRADELPAAEHKDSTGARTAVAITGETYRWPGGVIPYTIDSAMPNQSRVTNAIAHWNTKLAGHIQLVPRTAEVSFVKFIPAASSGTCSSYVGRMWYEQPVNVGGSCSTGNIIHEIGHTVGLWHEQTREDRDNFVKILWENISAGKEFNFYQSISNGDDIGAYNYGSIMHYPRTSFSKNGLPTIETIPTGIAIGQRSGLNANDIAAVKGLYPSKTIVAPEVPTVTIASNPTGMPVTIDGVSHLTPASVQWAPGSVHTISALDPTPANGTANRFVRWSDNGAASHTVTAATTATTYRADYTTSYSLTTMASPATGTVAIIPASADSFYSPGTPVVVNAHPPAGHCFTSWTGFIAGTPSRTTVNMDRAYQVQANFQAGSVTTLSTVSVPAAGGLVTIGVTATGGCSWKADVTSTWIALAGAAGIGSGVITASITPNTSPLSRSEIVTLGDQTVTIVQAGSITLSKVALSPAVVLGGVTKMLSEVVLNTAAPVDGVIVTITSSNPTVAFVPVSVTVASGQTKAQFSVVTTAVSVETAVEITAACGGVSRSSTLTVRPAALSLFWSYPGTVTAGLVAANNRVTLDGPAGPDGAVVGLTSSNSLVASVPAQVTVPPGATYASFPVASSSVLVPTTVNITASLRGVAKVAPIIVQPVAIESVRLSSTVLTGGSTSIYSRVWLNGPAPAGGVVIMLSTSNSAIAAVPASVLVPEGATYSNTFSVGTQPVSAITSVIISGTYSGVTKSAPLTVRPTT